jgi:hypothetical protein
MPTSSYQLTVSAVGGAAWVQVTDQATGSSLFSGIVQAGGQQVVNATGTVQVQLGASSGRLSATAKGQQVLATWAPPGAPFTATFTG